MTVFIEGVIAYFAIGAVIAGITWHDKPPHEVDGSNVFMVVMFWPSVIVFAMGFCVFLVGQKIGKRLP